eukprot:2419560-Prymnesium_polylepis.1
MARAIMASGSPEAPCSTSGRSPASVRTASRRAQSSTGGLTAYLPCTLPIVTASASTLVAARNDATVAGSVIFASSRSTDRPSSSPASLPSSASTAAPSACASAAIAAVHRSFSSRGKCEPSAITPSTPAASAMRMYASLEEWSSWTSIGAPVADAATSLHAAIKAVPPNSIDAGCSCTRAGNPTESTARRTARAPSML